MALVQLPFRCSIMMTARSSALRCLYFLIATPYLIPVLHLKLETKKFGGVGCKRSIA